MEREQIKVEGILGGKGRKTKEKVLWVRIWGREDMMVVGREESKMLWNRKAKEQVMVEENREKFDNEQWQRKKRMGYGGMKV